MQLNTLFIIIIIIITKIINLVYSFKIWKSDYNCYSVLAAWTFFIIIAGFIFPVWIVEIILALILASNSTRNCDVSPGKTSIIILNTLCLILILLKSYTLLQHQNRQKKIYKKS